MLNDYLKAGNVSKAVSHFEISALYGSKQSQVILANRYEKGDGVEQDYKRAYVYYNLAYRQPTLYGLWKPPNNEKHRDIINRLREQISKDDWRWAKKEMLRHEKEFSSRINKPR